MTLADLLGIQVRFRIALALGIVIALIAALIITPRTIRKLRGAGITGNDRHKPDRPEIPEMGGLAVFLAFNMGAFTALGFGDLSIADERLLLASLVVAAGAVITGVLDDLVVLRQRFKALIPFAFAAPLALFVSDTNVAFPVIGSIDFGLAYPLLLVPLGVACASNGFNMLEGFNGLGAGLGIIIAGAMSFICILSGRIAGLALLFPLIGALGGFLWFNVYPARIFPGDTMTLFTGATLATAAIVSKIEFWGALLLVPHIVEFFVKMGSGFASSGWGGKLDEDGYLHSERERPVGIAQFTLLRFHRLSEVRLVLVLWFGEAVLAALVVTGYMVLG